jgi:hypothetical protein
MADTPKKGQGSSGRAGTRAIEAARRAAAAAESRAPTDPAAKVAAAIRAVGHRPAERDASTPRTEARNAMLDALVYSDHDLVGLVAYAMHEVNRRDWCLAYETANGHSPSETELKAYLVGEQIERRLETYRRLAEDALAKVATGQADTPMRRLSEGVPEVSLGHVQTLVATTEPGAAAEPAADAASDTSKTEAPPVKVDVGIEKPVAAVAPPVVVTPALPVPATALARASALGATAADKAVVPVGSGKTGKLIFYLLFLLVAVIGLALLLKLGMDMTQVSR